MTSINATETRQRLRHERRKRLCKRHHLVESNTARNKKTQPLKFLGEALQGPEKKLFTYPQPALTSQKSLVECVMYMRGFP